MDRATETEPGLIGAQARSLSTRSCCKSFGKCRSRFGSLVLGSIDDPRLSVL